METRPAKRNKETLYKTGDSLTTAIMNGTPLTEEQEELYGLLGETWALMLDNPTKIVVELLKEEHGFNDSAAFRLISKTTSFFGEINQVKVDAERLRQKQWLEGIIYNDEVVSKKKISTKDQLKAMELLIKILGTASDESQAPVRQRPALIIFSSDPAILKGIEEETVDYEEVG